ncbi:hypothetical protein HAX54_000374 [Datura stramonium]|uniref:Uncharacterized protein n=1 Tax=Datura stramonium TaxID=4076 RepID=A0ABS8RSE8_DATST|nr:hypothetical protein [Datura stramonium]
MLKEVAGQKKSGRAVGNPKTLPTVKDNRIFKKTAQVETTVTNKFDALSADYDKKNSFNGETKDSVLEDKVGSRRNTRRDRGNKGGTIISVSEDKVEVRRNTGEVEEEKEGDILAGTHVDTNANKETKSSKSMEVVEFVIVDEVPSATNPTLYSDATKVPESSKEDTKDDNTNTELQIVPVSNTKFPKHNSP